MSRGILTGELPRSHRRPGFPNQQIKPIPLSQRLRTSRSSRRWIRLVVGTTILGSLIILLLRLFHPTDPPSLTSHVSQTTNTDPNLPTIDLVIAHTQDQDRSWTLDLPNQIPNLRLFPYCANCTTLPEGEYEPPLNKGNEVSSYLTYIIDHYHALSDISIFIHPHNNTWHAEPIFFSSTGWILTHLSLPEVERRGLLNLRITEPLYGGVDTTLGDDSEYEEGPFIRTAFLELFGVQTAGHVPPKLASPCCSQFAVTRSKILGRRLEDYQQMREWLYDTSLSSDISGRVWERLWQWVFLGKAKDVPRAWKALCVGWGICFENAEEYALWVRKQQKWDWMVQRRMGIAGNGRVSGGEWVELGEGIVGLEGEMEGLRGMAVERGMDEGVRRGAGESVFDEDEEGSN